MIRPASNTGSFPSLSAAECEELLSHLDRGLEIFDAKSGRLTAHEIHVKSLLGALRGQVQRHMTEASSSQPPFDQGRNP